MLIFIIGKPRSGKTTLQASYIGKDLNKRKLEERFPRIYDFLVRFRIISPYWTKIYSNDSALFNTTLYDPKTLGMWKPEEGSCVMLCEAAASGYSNRNSANLSEYAERFFCMYGHMKIDFIVDSQTVDVECKIRNRVDKYYIVSKKRPFSPKSIVQTIDYDIDVNDDTKKIEECYSVSRGPLKKLLDRLTGRRFTLKRRRYYHLFDSWSDDFTYPMNGPDDKAGFDAVMRSQKGKAKKIRK